MDSRQLRQPQEILAVNETHLAKMLQMAKQKSSEMIRDRVPSADRYQEKSNWGVGRFGEVDLPAGVTAIKLRATEIPGQQTVELKSVVLTRLSD